MYMFDLNGQYDRPDDQPPIQTKHVHSSVSYTQATYQKYDRRVHKSPSGYGPLRTIPNEYLCCGATGRWATAVAGR